MGKNMYDEGGSGKVTSENEERLLGTGGQDVLGIK
jgi:hypothetical protein